MIFISRSIALNTFLLLFISCITQTITAQSKFQSADGLVITKISAHTYLHTYDGNNGIIYVDNGECIIVSTPSTDAVTRELIKWIQDTLRATIKYVIIDSWHPDNMEGLDIVHDYSIRSVANEMTREIAKAKKLPVPEVGFHRVLELKAGNSKIEARYFGPAHTPDGIVAWIPGEKILFGGNAIRNYNGWIGNVADADINNWSETVSKIRNAYSSVKTVIPGHGDCGGPELLDYTMHLYQPGKWGRILRRFDITPSPVFQDFGEIFISAQKDSVENKVHFLSEVVVFVDKGNQFVVINSSYLKFDADQKTLYSDYGRIRITDRKLMIPKLDGYYKYLTLAIRKDAVGMTIVMKEIVR